MIRTRFHPSALLLALLLICLVTTGWRAEETADPGFDNNDYGRFLAGIVSNGRVDYDKVRSLRDSLDAFLDQVKHLEKERYDPWNDKEKIAFLINVYNALTLSVIDDHRPIPKTTKDAPDGSIRQIPDVWDRLKFDVAGMHISLNGIENDLLRKEFIEPRIHMALVCAAMGCPPLRKEPYQAERLDEQLDDQARRFLGDETKMKIDKESEEVYLSRIFQWFGKDFLKPFETKERFDGKSPDEKAVLYFISEYVRREDARYLQNAEYEIVYIDYDWSLNEVKKSKSAP